MLNTKQTNGDEVYSWDPFEKKMGGKKTGGKVSVGFILQESLNQAVWWVWSLDCFSIFFVCFFGIFILFFIPLCKKRERERERMLGCVLIN